MIFRGKPRELTKEARWIRARWVRTEPHFNQFFSGRGGREERLMYLITSNYFIKFLSRINKNCQASVARLIGHQPANQKSPVWFLVRAHAWVAGLVPSRGAFGRQPIHISLSHRYFCPSISPSLTRSVKSKVKIVCSPRLNQISGPDSRGDTVSLSVDLIILAVPDSCETFVGRSGCLFFYFFFLSHQPTPSNQFSLLNKNGLSTIGLYTEAKSLDS